MSSLIGFGSFLCYLGYGYLDTWHGVATLALLPIFILGMVNVYWELGQPTSFFALLKQLGGQAGVRHMVWAILHAGHGDRSHGRRIHDYDNRATTVFVPQDLAYMGLDVQQLRDINPHLVPLIAHDRAGFGGGVCCCGTTLLFCIWCGRPSRSLWQALFIAWAAGQARRF